VGFASQAESVPVKIEVRRFLDWGQQKTADLDLNVQPRDTPRCQDEYHGGRRHNVAEVGSSSFESQV